MARGQNASTGRAARSEAGTIYRGDTAQARIERANKLLQNSELMLGPQGGGEVKQADGSMKSVSEETRAILMGDRPKKDAYEIRLEGYNALKPAGKLNLLEGTIDGKKIDTAYQDRGAFDRSGTKSTKSDDAAAGFEAGKKYANTDQGFIFAADDDNKIYAIPHTWDTNDPQGTVGIFRGDRITNVDNKGKVMNLRVVGTFDSSPRGLQLAAAASGDFIGRTNGIKQTAIVLAGSSGGKYTVENVVAGLKSSPSQIAIAARATKRGGTSDGQVRKLDERLGDGAKG